MTKSALASEHLAHVIVIAVGNGGASTARTAFARDGGRVHFAESASKFVSTSGQAVASELEAITRNSSGVGYLPAVMIIANTDDANEVAGIIDAIREITPRARPRVWPTFTDGKPSDLAEFDQHLDELGQGACDVVLLTLGQPDVDAQSAALRAWLQIKVPAPASVLADLPDKDGKTCRYVALGADIVSELAYQPTDDSGDEGDIDSDHLVKLVEIDLRKIADSSSVVRVAHDAANRVCAAAEHFDVPELLQADNALVQAVADIDRTLVGTLESQVPTVIRDALARSSDESNADEVPASSQEVEVVTGEDRTALITSLVQMASKGSMSRVFKKSRMAGVSEQIASVARSNVESAVGTVIKHVSVGVPGAIQREAEKVSAAREAERERRRAELGARQESAWKDQVSATREAVAVWPAVDARNVRRSWGGGIPAPRAYIVTASSSVIALSEKDRAMTVIDLRDDEQRSVVDHGQPRTATVLIAQYGLPLSALR